MAFAATVTSLARSSARGYSISFAAYSASQPISQLFEYAGESGVDIAITLNWALARRGPELFRRISRPTLRTFLQILQPLLQFPKLHSLAG
jgi:hypothetical protein